jgi:hypothetical protein
VAAAAGAVGAEPAVRGGGRRKKKDDDGDAGEFGCGGDEPKSAGRWL